VLILWRGVTDFDASKIITRFRSEMSSKAYRYQSYESLIMPPINDYDIYYYGSLWSAVLKRSAAARWSI